MNFLSMNESYQCLECENRFENPIKIIEKTEFWGGIYTDTYDTCPFCGAWALTVVDVDDIDDIDEENED